MQTSPDKKTFEDKILETRSKRLEQQVSELTKRLETEITKKNELQAKTRVLEGLCKSLEKEKQQLSNSISIERKKLVETENTLQAEREKAKQAVNEVQKNTGQLRVMTRSLEAERYKATQEASAQKTRAEQAMLQVQGEMTKAVSALALAESERTKASEATKAAQAAAKQAQAERQKASELALNEKKQAQRLKEQVIEILKLVERAEKGDLTGRFEAKDQDSIAEIMRGLNSFFDNISNSLTTIEGSTTAVASSSLNLQEISSKMKAAATNSFEKIEVVASSSGQLGSSVLKVESTVQGMAHGIVKVSEETQKASRIAANAVTSGEETGKAIGQLSTACKEIQMVSSFISEIAHKTKMLSMNAKIESALAGDRGAGFGVVASEMKSMADETAEATAKIDKVLKIIIARAENGSQAMLDILQVIREVKSISDLVSTTVSQYRTEAEQMSSEILEITGSAKMIHQSINEITQGAEEAVKCANETEEFAIALKEHSQQSLDNVSKFKLR